jgi:hypothetical protein
MNYLNKLECGKVKQVERVDHLAKDEPLKHIGAI